MTRITRRELIARGATALSSVALASTASNRGAVWAAPASQTLKRGGRITATMPVDVLNFSPVLIGGTHYFMIARALYNTLTHYDEHLQPQPELAETWKFTNNNRRLELKLRPGVMLHSGRELTAEDVLATIDYVKDPKTGTAFRSFFVHMQASAPDKMTVVLESERPYALIFDALEHLYILDRDAIGTLKQHGVGTGPFKLAEYKPGDMVRFVPFERYWEKGQPYLNELVIQPIPDFSSMVANLEAGAVDVAWRIQMADFARLKKNPLYVADLGAPGNIFYCVVVNTIRAPFTDKRVRQAINWAVDRKRFVDTTLFGQVKSTSIPFPPQSLAYDPKAVTHYAYNLGKARELLTAAGVKPGLEISAIIDPKHDPGLLQLAEILQADLAKLGIKLDIEILETALWQRRFRAGDFTLSCTTFGRANTDPGTLFAGTIIWTTNTHLNPTRFTSPEYQRLVEQGEITLDREARKAIYARLLEIILDESFCMPVADNPRVWVYRRWVRGFEHTFDNIPYWGNVWRA